MSRREIHRKINNSFFERPYKRIHLVNAMINFRSKNINSKSLSLSRYLYSILDFDECFNPDEYIDCFMLEFLSPFEI